MKSLNTLNQSLYDLVHDNGGAMKIAQLPSVEIKPGTLQHKANPESETHQFSPAQLIQVMQATTDFRPLIEIARQCGHICLPNHELHDISDEAFLELYTAAMADIGNMARDINESFADHTVTLDEVGIVQRSCIKAASIILQIPERMRGMAEHLPQPKLVSKQI